VDWLYQSANFNGTSSLGRRWQTTNTEATLTQLEQAAPTRSCHDKNYVQLLRLSTTRQLLSKQPTTAICAPHFLSAWLLKAGKAGYTFCRCFLFILTIPLGQIISKSTEPILAKFSGLIELWIVDDPAEISFRSLEDVDIATDFCS